jgi:hypothetical protein
MSAVARCCSFSPALDYDLRLLERKGFSIKQFIPELGVEAFAIPVLPWATRHNVSRFGTDKRNPFPRSFGDKIRAIVGTNMRRMKRSELHFPLDDLKK